MEVVIVIGLDTGCFVFGKVWFNCKDTKREILLYRIQDGTPRRPRSQTPSRGVLGGGGVSRPSVADHRDWLKYCTKMVWCLNSTPGFVKVTERVQISNIGILEKTWATRDCQLPCLARKQWIQWDYWKRTSRTKKKRGKRCCQRAKCCSFMGFCSVLSQNIVGCNPAGASRSWLVDGMFEFNSCILPAQLFTER